VAAVEEETREILTAIGTRTVTEITAVATVIPTDGTAGTGANVVARPRPAVEGIHLTGGVGATPGAPQEAAAPAGITMRRPLRRRSQRRLRMPVGNRTTRLVVGCKWSKGNKKLDGQEVKYPSDEEVSGFVALKFQIFFLYKIP